jgi:hypothetical protein
VRRADLQYTWESFKTVNSESFQDFSLDSSSIQFYKFGLVPYTLIVNDEYLFTLTVYDPRTKLSNKASVIVNVIPANIVAIIAGGVTAAVIFESSLVIDASSSFDQDQSG